VEAKVFGLGDDAHSATAWRAKNTTSGGSPPVTVNVTTPGTVNRPDGNDVELWLEVYGAPGATTATWTVSYTDIVNGAGRTASYTHPANAETVGQMMPMTLAAGDTGVSAVASFTYSASSGTAGDVGITLLRRAAEIPLTLANIAQVLDAVSCGMPRIYDDACLALMVMCSGATSGLVQAALDIVQG
jgi:hypothetical protein